VAQRERSFVKRERAALADLLERLGPDARTLCGGWTTRDLAAHVVVRDRRPDTMPGLGLAPLRGWTEQVREDYASRPYDELVSLLRTGPGRLSPFALPGADALVNAGELVIHHEDVRRAQPGWEPRPLTAAARDEIWRTARRRALWTLRGLPARLVIRRSDADASVVVGTGEPRSLHLSGEPLELLLYLVGRRDVARVDVWGDSRAQAALEGSDLSL
jgi:uncharacterized protein (TIGR03085 family)